MKSYFFLGLDFTLILFSLWLNDKARVWLARSCGDPEAASRQRTADNPFSRVDWIGSVLLPAFLLWRHMPVLGWVKPLDIDVEKLRRGRRDGLLVAGTGPLVHVLLSLAAIGAVLALSGVHLLRSPQLIQIFISFSLNNACLGVFNLLPIPPLAGAAAAELLLEGDALSAFEEIKPYTFLLLLAGAFLNFFDFLTTPVTKLVFSLLGF